MYVCIWYIVCIPKPPPMGAEVRREDMAGVRGVWVVWVVWVLRRLRRGLEEEEEEVEEVGTEVEVVV
jgi:hypothetical protein